MVKFLHMQIAHAANAQLFNQIFELSVFWMFLGKKPVSHFVWLRSFWTTVEA